METSCKNNFNDVKKIDEPIKTIFNLPINKNYYHEFIFNKNDNVDNIFNKVVKDWESFYLNDKIESFVLIFNTKTLPTNIGLNYVFKMVSYVNKIKKMKKFNKNYNKLSGTVIYVENKNLRNLINILFKLSKPLSNVYLVENINDLKTMVECLKNNKDKLCYPNNVKILKP